jgi:hypothetical protein
LLRFTLWNNTCSAYWVEGCEPVWTLLHFFFCEFGWVVEQEIYCPWMDNGISSHYCYDYLNSGRFTH